MIETLPLIQNELKSILLAKPAFAGVPAATTEKYSSLGGLGVYQKIVESKLSLDKSHPVRWFAEATYVYNGQTNGLKAQGIGRFETEEGIFEGEFADGQLDGYVSFIDKDGN